MNSMSLDNVHNMRHFEHDILDVTHASTTVYPNAQQSEMHKGKKNSVHVIRLDNSKR